MTCRPCKKPLKLHVRSINMILKKYHCDFCGNLNNLRYNTQQSIISQSIVENSKYLDFSQWVTNFANTAINTCPCNSISIWNYEIWLKEKLTFAYLVMVKMSPFENPSSWKMALVELDFNRPKVLSFFIW